MRASEAERERTVSLLGDRFAEGYLSTDTFMLRVACAYAAKTVDELDALAGDLPARRDRWERLRRALRLEGLRLPRAGEIAYVGRSPTCDVVFADPTVSRVHVALEAGDIGWTIRDLGSTNGTWLHRRRITAAAVRAGSVVRLGGLRVVLRRPY